MSDTKNSREMMEEFGYCVRLIQSVAGYVPDSSYKEAILAATKTALKDYEGWKAEPYDLARNVITAATVLVNNSHSSRAHVAAFSAAYEAWVLDGAPGGFPCCIDRIQQLSDANAKLKAYAAGLLEDNEHRSEDLVALGCVAHELAKADAYTAPEERERRRLELVDVLKEMDLL